jgi:ADP-L-glycero-D-manno-heptose 6-epimerase
MIAVTGGAGFIGSAIIWRLNTLGEDNIIVVDELGLDDKWKNLVGLRFVDFINKNDFLNNLEKGLKYNFHAIIHMGANSSTTEKDADHLIKNNYEYTKKLAQFSVANKVRFIYASSGATYGDGSKGFDDNELSVTKLNPLNMYGYSKQLFDLWAIKQNIINGFVGLKYFNVYGPNEYHKGDMRSVVHKAFEQIRDEGCVRLFKSNNADYKDGEQMRDFVYVKDAVDMTLWFLNNKDKNGLYNIGSGEARTWKDLAIALFNALNKPVNIIYIEMPKHLEQKYQYFTEAKMDKIRNTGFTKPLQSLEEGVTDYVKNYLLKEKYFGI